MESVNFDRAAGYYDATRALPAETMADLTQVLGAELAGRQPCLEIGVGTGRIALPLRERGIALAGMDISGAMLRRLVANAEGLPFPLMQADATVLPVAAGTFGSVLAVHVLHLIPHWRVAVDEALRVLRPGGALVASFGQGRPERHPDAGETVPWRDPVQEVLRRHGIVRIRRGANEADEVAGYVSGRAHPRPLPPVTVVETRTLRQSVDSLEAQILSWTWPYSPEQVRAAGGDIRAWAAREDFPLDREYTVRSELQWWAFDVAGPRGLPRCAQQLLHPVQGVAEVVAADQGARLVHGDPAQHRVRALRPGVVRFPRGEDVPQVGVLVRGLALAGGDLADHRVPEHVVRPRPQVGQAGLLVRLAQRYRQRVALPRVAVPADLQPHPHPLVPAQQHPGAFRMHDPRRGGEVQRQRPMPRVRLGGEPPHPLDVGALGVPLWLVAS